MPQTQQQIDSARRSREYRRRNAAVRVRRQALTNAEKQRNYRRRRAALISTNRSNNPIPNTQDSTSSTEQPPQESNFQPIVREETLSSNWLHSTRKFHETFVADEFGCACDVCDRIWFRSHLKRASDSNVNTLIPIFGESSRSFSLCSNCIRVINNNKIPTMSKSNGFVYPPKPTDLPQLNPIATRIISPRIPFMSIRRLRRDGGYGIIGQVINVPIDINNMVRHLPRQLDDDYCFNVSIKRKLIHKSSYLSGSINKRVIKLWLEYLIEQPLYRHFQIMIDWRSFDRQPIVDRGEMVDDLDGNQDVEPLIARQQTILWDESKVLELAPGQNIQPLNLIYDSYAEELSFPQIYYGHARTFKADVSVTPYMIANSEIRRRDRRGVTPEHILYMAMKIMRLRVVDGIHNTFRCVQQTENITRRMIEDDEQLRDFIERDLSFLKSIPNSSLYWLARKKDLFAMMRQLGKPTLFMTLSANEINWPNLITTLHRLNDFFKDINSVDAFEHLNRSQKCHLVNEDPVTCCIYFNRMVEVLLAMLCAKKSYNPFGKYRVIDHFLRIEFQHRGSPHAHILLWLENDPKETVSESMPATIQLITDLCSVSQEDLVESYGNQVHRHTFTCTKRGESSCRFNIPYWPAKYTQILLPLPRTDGRIQSFQTKAKEMRKSLESKVYQTIESFLDEHRMTYDKYKNAIRSVITRPTVLFKRNMQEIMTNTFHPWIAKTINANMDIQFILEEFSCAAYVVDYVNKSNRGTGNLHRELIKLNEAHPEMTHDNLLKKLGSKILNTVEMSAQEAAWYLLRQHMSECSRDVVYVPTCWPAERQKSFKKKSQMDRENLGPESIDIWTKSLIQKYEDRPDELGNICLADFAVWYTPKRSPSRNINDEISDDDGEEEPDGTRNARQLYTKRKFSKILRYRHYEMSDIENFKREMVTLYVPFKNELRDIIDRNRYRTLYEQNLELIHQKRKEYDSGIDIQQAMDEMRRLGELQEMEPTVDAIEERRNFIVGLLDNSQSENFDDFNHISRDVLAVVRNRENVLTKEQYCSMMRTTNIRQRELILEVIHRLHTSESAPIQIFFTGPAGCGKTYVLKLIMETFNRYSQDHSSQTNAYIACASTGKAAVNLGGVTVHSAFHITLSKRRDSLARESLHTYRRLFANVRCVVIDEVSMIGSDILHRVNHRLQEITGNLEDNFGGMHIIFCGDFRQLPPVNATPVYKGSRNHIEAALLWQSLDYFPLTQVMRQNDAQFSSILTKIGNGMPLQVSESILIESRFVTIDWADRNLTGVVRLFHQNHAVDTYNNMVIENGVANVATDLFSGYISADHLALGRAKLHKMTTMESAGLPYIIKLAVGYPYMLTVNVNVEDGLVNGAIGILKFIDEVPIHADHQEGSLNTYRLWLQFDDNTGKVTRAKNRPAFLSRRGEISESWTPIIPRTASINLGNTLRCRRTQLPMTPACAITIHKSQGGTFDKAVIRYDKSQQNQLVYVALSRVTNIEGLYLTNINNDFNFYHKVGCTTPSVREIRDEYARLSNHPLETIASQLRNFKDYSEEGRTKVIICTINAQSLMAHSKDLETDTNINKSDILAITETWLDTDDHLTIEGFELNATQGTGNSTNSGRHRRVAGGVAIYRNIESPISCRSSDLQVNDRRLIQDSNVGNICVVEASLGGSFKFIIACLYIHPGKPKVDIELFLYYSLAKYCEATRRLNPSAEVDTESPLIVTGDFNTNITDNVWLAELMAREFHLTHVPSAGSTTLGGTTIDLTFARHLSVSSMSFVSYFSYHRPLFNRIMLE